jgi:hypothetical protein
MTNKNCPQSLHVGVSEVVNHSNAKAIAAAESEVVKPSVVLRCDECGKDFQPYRVKRDRYCSDRCFWDAWNASHVRLHRADLFAAFGKDWPAKIAAARDKRKGAA